MKNSLKKEEKEKKAPDVTLAMRVMEEKILQGQSLEACRRVLIQEKVWQQIDPELQLRWAGLAQMAGDVETALRVLSHLNRTVPEMDSAWEEHLEILALLDRKEDLARAAALRRHLQGNKGRISVAGSDLEKTGVQPAADQKSRISPAEKKPAANPDADTDAAVIPFASLRQEEHAISCFMSLFSGREDCFARQWADRNQNTQGYAPVRRAMTPADVHAHLSGRQTFGIYLIRRDETVKTAVIDADLVKDLRNRKRSAEENRMIRQDQQFLFRQIRELSAQAGLLPLTEVSGGKGYHFWFFFAQPVPAGDAQMLLCQIRDKVAGDLKTFHLEVFPKQAGLSGKGLGNLVKLPLGIHRLTGRPSYFPECPDRTRDGQMAFLQKIRPAARETLRFKQKTVGAEVVPLHRTPPQENFSELAQLENLCPPLAQVFHLCRSGNALSLREEKVVFQTLGFLPNAAKLVHYLMAFESHYNPHMTDYKLSRVRGTPLGCRRIHSLLESDREMCAFDPADGYPHPLLHLGMGRGQDMPKSEKIENLSSALENLETAIGQVKRFMC